MWSKPYGAWPKDGTLSQWEHYACARKKYATSFSVEFAIDKFLVECVESYGCVAELYMTCSDGKEFHFDPQPAYDGSPYTGPSNNRVSKPRGFSSVDVVAGSVVNGLFGFVGFGHPSNTSTFTCPKDYLLAGFAAASAMYPGGYMAYVQFACGPASRSGPPPPRRPLPPRVPPPRPKSQRPPPPRSQHPRPKSARPPPPRSPARSPRPPPGSPAKPCAGMVRDPRKCRCPARARCQRMRLCRNNFVCRCVNPKRRPIRDPKTGLLKACV